MSRVAEFTLTVKPGHYEQVLDLYSGFAHDYMDMDEHLLSVHIVGDPNAGIVRGIAVFDSEQAAAEVQSDLVFASFNDAIAPLISAPPQRVVLDLVHSWTR